MEEIIQIFIEMLFDFRRGLLRQVLWLDETIEKLTKVKDKGSKIRKSDLDFLVKKQGRSLEGKEIADNISVGGLMPVDAVGLRKAAEALEIENLITPNDCEHPRGFKNGQCDRCGVYEEFAKPAIIKKADKPDK